MLARARPPAVLAAAGECRSLFKLAVIMMPVPVLADLKVIFLRPGT